MKNVILIAAFVLLHWTMPSAAYSSNEADSIKCNNAIANAHILNAQELWQGASECGKAEDLYHSTFLLLSGQLRAITDMTMLKSATDEDDIKIGELYGILFYQTGGSGYDEIYQDHELSKSLFSTLEAWKPEFTSSYDPGWKYKSKITTEKYGQMIACQKATRLEKLNWYASLFQNKDYVEANKALKELSSENPGPVTSGSAVEKKMNAIMSRMRKASSGKSLPSAPLKECEFASKYEPDPDATFLQLYKGANGPISSKALVFESKEQVLESWISKSLSSNELNGILEQVNFENQILVSLSFGKRRNSTGTIHISDVDYNSILKSLHISGLIGVNGPKCVEPNADSYPFALAVALRPEKVPTSQGNSQQNFPDGCKPAMNGSFVSE